MKLADHVAHPPTPLPSLFFLRLLLEMGADPNLSNKSMQTPLHLASLAAGSAAMVRVLLAANTDPNVFDIEVGCRGGGTDLMVLTHVVILLFSFFSLQRMTPLMYACRRGCIESVLALLEGGADAGLTDTRQMTALMHAGMMREFARVQCSCLPQACSCAP